MIHDIYSKKKLVSSWFSLLQQTICYEFQKIEIDFGKKISLSQNTSKKRYGKNLKKKMKEEECFI